MDPLTLAATVIGIAAAVAGLVAAIVQIREYREKRRAMADETVKRDQSPTTLTAPQVPHNLPARSEFIGRETEKARVHEALQSRSYLVSIDGIGGIGKTVLALEVAHECLRASRGDGSTDGIAAFDGFIWTTAKDRDLTLNSLLDAVARTLDYPGIAQKPVGEKRDAVRGLLRDKPYLLMVDNFETVTDEGVRDFLLELPEPSKTLITTREQRLRQAWAVSLKGLTESESLALIRIEGKRLGLTSLERAEDQVLLHLYQATGGAPLAIKWAVGQIKQRGQSLDTVLTALHEARGNIFDNMFTRSWGLLSTTARQVLIAMPIFATSASQAGIEAASDVHHFALDEAVGHLVEMSLMDATDELDLTQRRYSVHPLTRFFAEARLSKDPNSEENIRLRLSAYYIESCKRIGRWEYTEYFPWFEAELPNIIAVIEWANRTQRWSTVISIFDHLFYFLGTYGYWQERIRYGQMALRAAQEVDDHLAIAVFQHSLGWILSRQGHYWEAEQLLHSCVQSCTDLGETGEAVRAMTTLAKIAIARSDLDGSSTVDRGALKQPHLGSHSRQEVGVVPHFCPKIEVERHSAHHISGNHGLMRCYHLDSARKIINGATKLIEGASYERTPQGLLSAQGRLELRSGNLEAAHVLLLRALEETQRRGSSASTGSRYIDLGSIALAQNHLEEAVAYFEAGLESSQQFRRQDNIAKAKFGLAKAHAFCGNKSEAIRLAQIAQEQFVRMGMGDELSEVDALLRQLENSEEEHE